MTLTTQVAARHYGSAVALLLTTQRRAHSSAPHREDTMEDYLQEAKHCAERWQVVVGAEAAQSMALIGILNALIALAERLDMLTEFDGGKALFVTQTR